MSSQTRVFLPATSPRCLLCPLQVRGLVGSYWKMASIRQRQGAWEEADSYYDRALEKLLGSMGLGEKDAEVSAGERRGGPQVCVCLCACVGVGIHVCLPLCLRVCDRL